MLAPVNFVYHQNLDITHRALNTTDLSDTGHNLFIEPQCKLQYFGHLMQRVDSLEKTLMLEGLEPGGEGDDRG